MFSPNITTKISTKNMMGGTSQDQSHNVITIEHAIVSRIFMACKEHSWRNVLVGGFETGSRPSRKCKSMQILWVKNICFFPSCLFQNRPTEFKDTRNILHTVSLPAFAMFLQDPSRHYVGHLLLANHFGTSTLTVNAAFSLAMMLWPQVRLCYIRCWMAEANPRFQDPRFDFSSCLRYNNYSTICTGFAPDWMSLSSLVYQHCLQRTSHTYGTPPHR
jgi:hypothetical protein